MDGKRVVGLLRAMWGHSAQVRMGRDQEGAAFEELRAIAQVACMLARAPACILIVPL